MKAHEVVLELLQVPYNKVGVVLVGVVLGRFHYMGII